MADRQNPIGGMGQTDVQNRGNKAPEGHSLKLDVWKGHSGTWHMVQAKTRTWESRIHLKDIVQLLTWKKRGYQPSGS